MRQAGATLHCVARASHCSGFSCCGARALGARTSAVAVGRLRSCGSQALERRLSSCGARALLLCGMWDLPGPEIEPVSPELAGRFLTTVPPGMSGWGVLTSLLYRGESGNVERQASPLGSHSGHFQPGSQTPQPTFLIYSTASLPRLSLICRVIPTPREQSSSTGWG